MDKPQEPKAPEESKEQTPQVEEVKSEELKPSEEKTEEPVEEEKVEETKPQEESKPEEKIAEEPAASDVTTSTPGASGKKGNSMLFLALGAFIIILLVAAGLFALWYFVIRDNNKSNNNNSGNTTSCTFDAQLLENTAIQGADAITVGGTFTKEWQVKNTGTCEWKGDVKAIYVSGDTTGSTTTITLDNVPKDLVSTVSLNLTAPATAGTYDAVWQLQTSKGVLFGDALPLSYTVKATAAETAPADLVVTQVSTSPSSVRQGVEFTVTAKVKNIGGKQAKNFKVAWRSCNASTCAYINFPGTMTLDGNETKSISMTHTYTTWSTYTSGVKVDVTNIITESDETNNTEDFPIVVAQGYSDLTITAITFDPTTPVMDADTTITITYKNKGYRAVTQDISLKWWQSASAPTPGCDLTVNNIDIGETKTATCHYTFPSWYPSITTRAQIDVANVETEVSETNNTLEKTISVTVP